MGGGGCAGGYVSGTTTIAEGTYTIVVGSGGAGAPRGCSGSQPCGHYFYYGASQGGNSYISGNSFTYYGIGGGYGASSYWGYPPNYGYGGSGGSGGGASAYANGYTGRYGSTTQGNYGY